ncbi:MAG: futalosine hydrolase [Candidatus Velthaea sp.]
MILVVCAVAQELHALAPRAGVEVAAVGVGPVEAAAGAARALAARPYRALLNAGIGGGFRARAKVGDVVAVDIERYHELRREDGEPPALPGGVTLVTDVRSDAALVAAYRAAVPRANIGGGVTSATITTTDARAAEFARWYDAAVESMEGFAILRAAELARVPALEIRGISNIVGDRASSGWDFRAGTVALAAAAGAFLDALAARV